MTSSNLPPGTLPSPTPDKIPIALPPAGPTMKRRALTKAIQTFRAQRAWKKLLLTLAMVMAITGFVGIAAGVVRSKPPEQAIASVTVEELQGQQARASLTPDQKVQLDQAKQQLSDASHWFYDKTAPHLWKWGLSFCVMFILGFAFRQFIKTMASLAAIVLVGAGIAAYFGYINLGEVRTNLTSGTGWMMDQMTVVKETVIKFIGASLVGTAGFVIGFMRR